MNWLLVIDFLRFISIGILILIPLILLKIRHRDQQIYLSITLCFSIISYLLADWHFLQNSPLQFILFLGAFSLSVIFWLFSRCLFEDDFKFNWQHSLILAGVITVNYFLFLAKLFSWFSTDTLISTIFSFLSQTISFIFIFLAVFTAFRDRESDLIEERIRLRKQFILATTILIGLTLLAEITLRQDTAPELLNFAQKVGVTALVYYFAFQNLMFDKGFFLAKTQITETPFLPEPEILASLKNLLENEKIYRKDGLTIKMFSDALDEKEYKVRRLINQHLGFRNFNDFLNQYRVQEACEILLDEKQANLTIIEIAYYLGYQSLGPFNAAFKKLTNSTPTAYRKKHLNKSSEPV